MTVPTPPGWYPDLGGRPVQWYFDGTQWTEHPHPPAPRSATVAAPRVLLALIVVGAMALVAVPSLFLFLLGAYDYHQYSRGTPTTATEDSCARGGVPDRAMWTVGGQTQFGPIETGFFDGCDRGSPLDVHVYHRKAYTADSWTTYFVLAGCVLAGGLFVVFVVAFAGIRPRLIRR